MRSYPTPAMHFVAIHTPRHPRKAESVRLEGEATHRALLDLERLYLGESAPPQELVSAGTGRLSEVRLREALTRTSADLRAARRVQQMCSPASAHRLSVPRSGPGGLSIDIGGVSHPAGPLNGDCFDSFPLPGGAWCVAVGDACGHGPAAALLMAGARACLRCCVQAGAGISEALSQVNRLLASEVNGEYFVTMFVARLDPSRCELEYASAGHPAGYLLDRGGRLKTELPSTGLPLGIDPGAKFPLGTPVALGPGEMALLLTDGLTEANDPGGTPFGERRALELARLYGRWPAACVAANLYHAARAFSQCLPQADDMTAVALKLVEE